MSGSKKKSKKQTKPLKPGQFQIVSMSNKKLQKKLEKSNPELFGK